MIEQRVVVVAIILKSKAEEWLGQHGVPGEEVGDEENSNDGDSTGLSEIPPSG